MLSSFSFWTKSSAQRMMRKTLCQHWGPCIEVHHHGITPWKHPWGVSYGAILYAKTVRLFGNFLQFRWKVLPCKNSEVRAIYECFQLFGSALRSGGACHQNKTGVRTCAPPVNSVGARKVTVSEGDGGLPWLSRIWTESIIIKKSPRDSLCPYGLNTRKSGLVNVCFLD